MPGDRRPERAELAGRDGDLEQVGDLLSEAVAGRSGGLLVVGEAGVGKTSLARRACADAGDEVACLWGTCLPLLSTTVPFLPLTDAVRDWAHTGTAPAPRAPGLAAPGDAPAAFDAWLSELCARQPVLLVVDDLQWADQSSLDVLMFLLAGPQWRRLAVLTTIREGETSRYDLRRWLADVRRLPRVRELRLAPLDRVATGQLLAGRLGEPPHESLIDDVFARSQGNAYLATLLARDLPANARSLPPGLPGQLREAVARTWFGLSEPARELTRLVAVAGRPQQADVLREAAAGLLPHLDVTPALREAVQAGVLAGDQDGTYWFAHPLLAEVLEADLPQEEARAWHVGFALVLTRRIAAAGPPDAGSAVALADHCMKAGDLPNAFRLGPPRRRCRGSSGRRRGSAPAAAPGPGPAAGRRVPGGGPDCGPAADPRRRRTGRGAGSRARRDRRAAGTAGPRR